MDAPDKDRLSQIWPETHTYDFLQESGLDLNRVFLWRIRSGFMQGRIDGSLDDLEKVAAGHIYIHDFGTNRREALAIALIRYWKARATEAEWRARRLQETGA